MTERFHPIKTPLVSGRCNFVAGSYRDRAIFLKADSQAVSKLALHYKPNTSTGLDRILQKLETFFCGPQ